MPIVNLYANLRKIAGASKAQVGGRTVREALLALCSQFPPLQERIWQGDEIRPLVIVSLNGRHIDFSGGLETPVSEVDDIAVFPPLAGG